MTDPWKERYFFVKRASIPDGKVWPQEWTIKGRILISSIMFGSDSYNFSFCDAAPKFEELAPGSADTEERIQAVLSLPDVERSFRLEFFPAQETSSNTEMTSGMFTFNCENLYALNSLQYSF